MILPKVLTAELTYRCNHSYLFFSCPWENEPKLKETELSVEEQKSIFSAIKTRDVNQITFSGGKTTFREDAFKILDNAKQLGFISNGKNINNNFLL